MGEGEILGRLLPALALVISAPLLLRQWLRKGRVAGGEELKVAARAPLGRASSVVIVDSGGRRFLLGVTESSMQVIAELQAPEGADTAGTDARGAEEITGPRTGLEHWRRMTLRRSDREPVRVIGE